MMNERRLNWCLNDYIAAVIENILVEKLVENRLFSHKNFEKVGSTKTAHFFVFTVKNN